MPQPNKSVAPAEVEDPLVLDPIYNAQRVAQAYEQMDHLTEKILKEERCAGRICKI